MPLKNLKQRLKLTPKTRAARDEADLINAESALGRMVFGPVPEGHTREFFHHQKNVWIWYENGVTIRYEVRPHGVFKKVASGKYHQITGAELANFRTATKAYLKLIKKHLYN